jgi:hypothetical protein
MRYRVTIAAVTTGVLLLGGTAACSSGGSSTPSPSPSPVQSAEATPNGVEQLDAQQILQRAQTAAKAAESVKVSAQTQEEAGAMSFEITMAKTGAQGTVTNAQGSLELIATEDTIFIKGDEKFNQAYGGQGGAALLQGKWLSIPSDNPQAQPFQGLVSLETFFQGLLTPETTPTKVTPKDVNGVRCVGLQTDSGTLWVATTGEPYPMAIEPPSGQQGNVTMTDWNAPVTISAPPQDQVVDITKLGASTSPSPSAS